MADLFRDLVDELMLGLLPPFKLLIGLRSRSLNMFVLFLGWITDTDDDKPSSLPFRRFLVISLDKSLILFSAVRGLSGGRLAARDELVPLRLEVELADLASLTRDGRELFRLLRLADLPLDNRSNTLEFPPPPPPPPLAPPLGSFDFDNLSIREFLRVTGFFRSFSECPGLILPELWPSACSTLIIGTDVTYLPSTSSES